MAISLVERERTKYEAAWELPEYAKYSPGAWAAPVFLDLFQPPASVIDLGCGRGDGGRVLAEAGFDVVYLDVVDARAEDLRGKSFRQRPLWNLIPVESFLADRTDRYDIGYCCDVMEHIPTEMVGLCLHRIRISTSRTFFTIGLTPDSFGAMVGEPLHLTVRPFTWWRDFLREFGKVTEARDLGASGLYVAEWN